MVNIIIGILIGAAAVVVAALLLWRKIAARKVNVFIENLKNSDETILQFMARYLGEKETDEMVVRLKQSLCEKIYAKLSDEKVGESVSSMVVDHICDRLSEHNHENQQDGRGFLGNIIRSVADRVVDGAEAAINNNRELIEQKLADKINEIIKNNGEEMISQLVDSEIDKVLEKPLRELIDGNDEMLEMVKETMMMKL